MIPSLQPDPAGPDRETNIPLNRNDALDARTKITTSVLRHVPEITSSEHVIGTSAPLIGVGRVAGLAQVGYKVLLVFATKSRCS